MNTTKSKLKNVMLLIRDVPRAVKFYRDGLGCEVNYCSDHWAELTSGTVTLTLNKTESEAAATTGYSPFLCFNVKKMDKLIHKLLEMGASLDGPIKYPAHGKIAALRAPDGHMIGLFEPNSEEDEDDDDNNNEIDLTKEKI